MEAIDGGLCAPSYGQAWRRERRLNQGDVLMAWKAPKVSEVPVGMEINMYACAKQK
jgi:coenzyme PQQ precursor peptide PqqA